MYGGAFAQGSLNNAAKGIDVRDTEVAIGKSNYLATNTAGNWNTIVGYSNDARNASSCVIIGRNMISQGNKNTIIGSNILVQGSNNVVIGAPPAYYSTFSVVDNNAIYIGGVKFPALNLSSSETVSGYAPTLISSDNFPSNIVVLGRFNDIADPAYAVTVVGTYNSSVGSNLRDVMVGRGNVNTSNVGDCVSIGYFNQLSNNTATVAIGQSATVIGCTNTLIYNTGAPRTFSNRNYVICFNDAMTISSAVTTIADLRISTSLTAPSVSGVSSITFTENGAATWQLSSVPSGASAKLQFTNLQNSNARFTIGGPVDTTLLSFTGVHRCVVDPFTCNLLFTGALVRSTGRIKNLDGSTVPDKEAIPIVEITSKAEDPAVYGVFGKMEDNVDGWRTFSIGNMSMDARCKDVRGHIYSSGEGSLFAEGPIDVGDLLSSSSTPGVAHRQPDNTGVYNYTVAKATTSLGEGERGLIGVMYLL